MESSETQQRAARKPGDMAKADDTELLARVDAVLRGETLQKK